MNTITKPTDGTTADSDTKAEPIEIDPRIFDLYDEFCHSDMDRRTFLSRVAALGIVGGVA
jgi:carboxymethylenebutenolidase